jgi:hypothetical protein
VKKYSAFYGSKCSSPCSQQPYTGPYSESKTQLTLPPNFSIADCRFSVLNKSTASRLVNSFRHCRNPSMGCIKHVEKSEYMHHCIRWTLKTLNITPRFVLRLQRNLFSDTQNDVSCCVTLDHSVKQGHFLYSASNINYSVTIGKQINF